MSHDSDHNPFRNLAKDLAARGKNGGQAGHGSGQDSGMPRSGPAQPAGAATERAKSKTAGSLTAGAEDDAALFLDAVSSIKPLKKSGKGGGPDLGRVLARQMRDNQAGAGPRQGSAGAARAGATAGRAGTGDLNRSGDGKDFTAPQGGAAAGAGAGVNTGSGAGAEGLTAARQPGKAGAFAQAASATGNGYFSGAVEAFFAGKGDSGQGEASGPGAARSDEEEALFAKAMQGVTPVSGGGRDLAPPVDASRPLAAHDPAKALREMLEGKLEFTLQHTDEHMEGFVLGLDPLVLARLRAGRYSPEKHLDLHGLNARQAHDALTLFIKDAYQRNMRCVVVVTGRGRNSPDGVGVLRPLLQGWLTREPFKRVVLAFCSARPGDGGPGAVYVLLRKYKKSRGKIIWERTPADDDFPDV